MQQLVTTTFFPQQARVDAHMYDLVAAEPQYAQVNKKRKQNENDLHYAEIQVLQSENATSRGKLKQTSNHENTEYATIDFKTPVNTQTSAEPADLFIPPGELQRPNMSFSHRKNVHSKRAVMAWTNKNTVLLFLYILSCCFIIGPLHS